MRVINSTGVDSIESKVIESPTQKLKIVYKPTNAAALVAELDKIKFEATVSTNTGGTKPVIHKMLLKDLLEIASSNEGFMRVDVDGTVSGSIELSNTGSLRLGESQLQISFYGLTTTGTLKVFTIDSEHLSDDHIVYQPISFNANAPKQVACDEFYQIAVPSELLEKLEFVYPNGRNIQYLPEELDLITDEINELSTQVSIQDSATSLLGGKVFGNVPGHTNFYCIGCDSALEVKITLTETANVYFIKNEPLF